MSAAKVAAHTPGPRRERSSDRFVVEATWSGYTSAQSTAIRHRTVEPRYKAERMGGLVIPFGDGTSLFVTARPCKPRERVQEIHGYDHLIGEAMYKRPSETAARGSSKADGGRR